MDDSNKITNNGKKYYETILPDQTSLETGKSSDTLDMQKKELYNWTVYAGVMKSLQNII